MSKKSKKKSLFLPISGETIFQKKLNPVNPGDEGQLFIDRMYAQGGFVIVQMLNYKTNKMERRMLDPNEAGRRLQAIRSSFPPQYIPDGLIEAGIKAVSAAKSQTLEGQNEFLKANQNIDIPEMIADITREIQAARTLDPGLDEEMGRIEAGI